ncbi:MAG: hypothetical protein FJZ60_00005 [Chlamydiae bacterium]|nr:hypothetical protein [Chlamydiota bacterium]
MTKLEEDIHVQWTGTNFPEIYEWLVSESATHDFVLRIDDPGNPRSAIEIKVDGFSVRLRIGDRIVKDVDNLYYVVNDEVAG